MFRHAVIRVGCRVIILAAFCGALDSVVSLWRIEGVRHSGVCVSGGFCSVTLRAAFRVSIGSLDGVVFPFAMRPIQNKGRDNQDDQETARSYKTSFHGYMRITLTWRKSGLRAKTHASRS